MSRSTRIPMLGVAVTLLAGLVAGQEYPESLGESLGDWPLWRAASKSVEPDGSIKWSLPDFGQIDRATAIWAKEKIDQFKEKFGSAESRSLAELSYPPESYCYVPDYERLTVLPPDPEIGTLEGTLLLSEVAVTATVSEIIPGFSGGAGPMVLLGLSDGVQLTDRSPIPDYVLIPLRRMVIGGIPFCHDRDEGVDYEPQLGDRVVVIGAWLSGIVSTESRVTGMLFELKSDGRLERAFASGSTKSLGTIGALRAYVDRLDFGGFLEATAHLARQSPASGARREFARTMRSSAAARAECPIDGLSVTRDGGWTLSFDCPEVER